MALEAPENPFGGQRPDPAGPPHFVPIWKGRGRDKWTWQLLNPKLFGLFTHWDGYRVLPCTLPLGRCAPCIEGWDRRWRAFVGALSGRTRGQYLLQVTKLAWEECPELAELDGQLRGHVFAVWRTHDAKCAPWKWQRVAHPVGEPHRRPTDVVAVLSKLWGLDLAALATRKDFDGDIRPLLKPFERMTERRAQ
jgi:hypothetical protein